MERTGASSVRLAELTGALSLVVDLGLGQPMEHVLRQTLLAVRLGDALGLPEADRAALYYVSLLAWVGCGSDSHELAMWFGDDVAFRGDSYGVDLAGADAFRYMLRKLGSGSPALERARIAAAFLAKGSTSLGSAMHGHCMVTRSFAERLGLGPEVAEPLLQIFERWDGKGAPDKRRGDAIHIAARVVALADIVTAFHRAGGADAARGVAAERRGKHFDPDLVDLFRSEAPALLDGIGEDTNWDELLSSEPGSPRPLDDDELDRAIEAVADFTDLKAPALMGHARAVSALAAAAGTAMGWPPEEVALVRRAALLQDAGRMGITNAIWDKPGPLTPSEVERVRLHAYYVDRMLARPPALARIGAIAAQHHERLDGSGYPRGLTGAAVPMTSRVLAVADVYAALVEDRPHRPALDPGDAATAVREQARAGRLDADAVEAVLGAAGHRVRKIRPYPSGLTPREVEVLALIARGLPNREVARRLHVSAKTVGNHVEHIYAKLGVRSRAEAGLFAMQHGLLSER